MWWYCFQHVAVGSRTTNMGFSSSRPRIWKYCSRQKLKQIVSTFGKPDTDLFASWINNWSSNYISWRPYPGAKAVNAFSINWSPSYNYCFPPFSIILKVLQKIQHNKVQAIVVVTLLDHTELVLCCTPLRNAGRPPSNNDSLIEYIVSPYLCTQQHLTLCIPSFKKLLVAHITGEKSSHKMFQQQHNIYSCPFEENHLEDDITRCCISGISAGGRKPLICYQMWPQSWNFSPSFTKKAVNTALLL